MRSRSGCPMTKGLCSKQTINAHFRQYVCRCARVGEPFANPSDYLPFICGMSRLFSLQTSSIKSVSTINASGCV